MFVGEYTHALDPKGRLTVPARLRDGLEGGLVVTRGYDTCLMLYPQEEWEQQARRVSQMPTTSRERRIYTRWIFGGASEVPMDKLGRILIPGHLRQHAEIDDEVVVVGANHLIELWNPRLWRAELEYDRAELNDILDGVSRMGV